MVGHWALSNVAFAKYEIFKDQE